MCCRTVCLRGVKSRSERCINSLTRIIRCAKFSRCLWDTNHGPVLFSVSGLKPCNNRTTKTCLNLIINYAKTQIAIDLLLKASTIYHGMSLSWHPARTIGSEGNIGSSMVDVCGHVIWRHVLLHVSGLALRWRHNGRDSVSITSLTIVYSTVYSGADQSKHQSSASLAFVWGIHRGPVNSPHKWSVTRKMFPIDDVIMERDIFTSEIHANKACMDSVTQITLWTWKGKTADATLLRRAYVHVCTRAKPCWLKFRNAEHKRIWLDRKK